MGGHRADQGKRRSRTVCADAYNLAGEGYEDEDANNLLKQSSVKNVFIRGSVVRYVHLPAASVDTPLLEDATRRGMLWHHAIFWLI